MTGGTVLQTEEVLPSEKTPEMAEYDGFANRDAPDFRKTFPPWRPATGLQRVCAPLVCKTAVKVPLSFAKPFYPATGVCRTVTGCHFG